MRTHFTEQGSAYMGNHRRLQNFTIYGRQLCRTIRSAALLLLLLPLLPGVAAASETEILVQVQKLQQYYQSVDSITFNFEQHTYSNGRDRQGSGNAAFVRLTGGPENGPIMRWNYLTPDEQIILSTDSEVRIYTRQDNQLIITPAESMDNDITFALFSGRLSLEETFNITRIEDDAALPGIYTALLVPQTPHQQVQSIRIWFDHNQILRRLRIDDHFGTRTILSLSDFAVNSVNTADPEVVKNLNFLNIPPDAEIIRQ